MSAHDAKINFDNLSDIFIVIKTLIRKMIKNSDSVSLQEIDILLPVLMFSNGSLH